MLLCFCGLFAFDACLLAGWLAGLVTYLTSLVNVGALAVSLLA